IFGTLFQLFKTFRIQSSHLFIILTAIFFIISLINNSISLIIIATMAVYFTCGSIFPLSMGKGISMFRHVPGTAAAIMYFVNISMTSLTSFLQSYVHAHNVTNIISIYLVLMFIIVGLYWYKLKDL
ncbi:hypothetical protein IB662_07930, partial [Francisella noatunensis]|nr:hypothetical protein [Francisella noatunensis]MBK2069906.1 hypothetical protein [Francisella noatunensis]